MTDHDRAHKPATLDDVRRLGTVPVWHATKPDAADVLGVSRRLAYALAERGELPTLRLGSRLVVPVPKLLAMLGDKAGLSQHQDAQAADLRREDTSHADPGVPLTTGPAR